MTRRLRPAFGERQIARWLAGACVNKWMIRFWGAVAVLSLVALLVL